VPNSNSHSIDHIYSDAYRHANGGADRHQHAPTVALSYGRKNDSLFTRMKSWLRFWNYRPRFIVDLRLSWKVMRSSMFC
jgi:hypothetical protein